MKINDKAKVIVDETCGYPQGYIGTITSIDAEEDATTFYEVDGKYEYAKEELEIVTIRRFQRIQGSTAAIPQRATAFSAGYDIESAMDITLPPMKVTLIPTGLKVYMGSNEYLGLHLRSSMGVKHSLMLVNSQGIIDADYVDNPDNEGHIQFPVINLGTEPVTIQKGQRIGQGIFYRYLVTDDDNATGERSGGFGSTNV